MRYGLSSSSVTPAGGDKISMNQNFNLQTGSAKPAADFNPAWWCRGAHLQTILGSLLRPDPHVPVIEEKLETPDGDFLVLDWLKGEANSPLVIILHGLGSSSRVPYVKTLLKKIQTLGWQAVALNARGTTEPNRLSVTSHGGKTEDLDWVVRQIINRKITEKIYLAGFSIGGNQALKWLGEQGDHAPVQKAVAVSVPYNLAASVLHLDQGFNQKVYAARILKILKERALEKETLFPGILNRQVVEASDTYRVYDHEVTAKLNGFKNEDEYWRLSSCDSYLQKIRKPVLLIHAANDPLLPKRDLSLKEIGSSKFLQLLLTPDGGHLGFVSGACPFHIDDWLESIILDYLVKS